MQLRHRAIGAISRWSSAVHLNSRRWNTTTKRVMCGRWSTSWYKNSLSPNSPLFCTPSNLNTCTYRGIRSTSCCKKRNRNSTSTCWQVTYLTWVAPIWNSLKCSSNWSRKGWKSSSPRDIDSFFNSLLSSSKLKTKIFMIDLSESLILSEVSRKIKNTQWTVPLLSCGCVRWSVKTKR